jgi:pyruvate,water dikinase
MKYIRQFYENLHDITLLGGKGLNLVKLFNENFNVPPGFILTTKAQKDFMNNSEHKEKLFSLISKDIQLRNLLSDSEKIQNLILDSTIPVKILNEIKNAYISLKRHLKRGKRYAVRSSATIEDSQIASFAGQADTYLFRESLEEIIYSIKKCWTSLYSPRSILYITQLNKMGKNISLDQVYMAVIVQEMIHSDISGVLFTANVLNNNRDQILINSCWGLGEALANNIVIPDTIILDKDSSQVVRQIIGKKEKMVVPDMENSCTKITETRKNQRKNICISQDQIKNLHRCAVDIESLYEYPQDIEWAIKDNEIFILQTRPITTLN